MVLRAEPPGICYRQVPTGKRAPKSLVWRGDELIDWVNGGDLWTTDGEFHPAHRSWGYSRFDAATCDASGRWVVVYERLGTAGILLCDGKIVREIHRSPYHADTFEYAVCLFDHRGRILLAHCPTQYGQLEIDDAETGERLTETDSRDAPDFFHSRLQASADGERLLSGGWFWHPWDAVLCFDVAEALEDPDTLDTVREPDWVGVAEASAAWVDDETFVVGSGREDANADPVLLKDSEGPCLDTNGFALIDATTGETLSAQDLGFPPGLMMVLPTSEDGERRAVTFYRHPRLISLDTGEILHEWPTIDAGAIASSIVGSAPYPVLAKDPEGARFAVWDAGVLHIVEFNN